MAMAVAMAMAMANGDGQWAMQKETQGRSIMILRSWVGNRERRGNQMLTQITHRGARGKPKGTQKGKQMGAQSSPRTEPKVPLESSPVPPEPNESGNKKGPRTQYHDSAFIAKGIKC